MPGKGRNTGQGHDAGARPDKAKDRDDWTGGGGGDRLDGDDTISLPAPIEQGGPMGAGDDDVHPDHRGRSESSPGHLKKTAGAHRAREFAPGHTARNRPGGP